MTSLMMSSCWTLRLKRRRAFSIDSPSWTLTSATTHTPPISCRTQTLIIPRLPTESQSRYPVWLSDWGRGRTGQSGPVPVCTRQNPRHVATVHHHVSRVILRHCHGQMSPVYPSFRKTVLPRQGRQNLFDLLRNETGNRNRLSERLQLSSGRPPLRSSSGANRKATPTGIQPAVSPSVRGGHHGVGAIRAGGTG